MSRNRRTAGLLGSVADRVLLTAHDGGIENLPEPVPIAVMELPLAAMARYEPRPDPATGQVPRYEWEQFHTVRSLTGREFAVRITGDAQLGLPRAGDWPVLMALLALYERDGWRSNVLVGPSLSEISVVANLPRTGPSLTRVRRALQRFAHVRVTVMPLAFPDAPSRVFERQESGAPHTGTVSDGLLSARRGSGRRTPRSAQPDTTAFYTARTGAVTHVLDVVWDEDRIAEVSLADAWRPPQSTTPTAWIDYQTYFALHDPVAQRLYQLLAASVAKGSPTPWEGSLSWLRTAIGFGDRHRPARIADLISAGLEELVAAGVLSAARLIPTGGRPDRAMALAGPVLRAAELLAGYALTDPVSQRTRLALLQHLGLRPHEARALLATDEHQAHEAILFVLWALKHDPDAVRMPAKYVAAAVKDGYKFADPAYRVWRRRLEADTARQQLAVGLPGDIASPRPAPHTLALLVRSTTPEPERPARLRERPMVPDTDPAAQALWDAACAQLRAAPRSVYLDMLLEFEHAATPYRIDETILEIAVYPMADTLITLTGRPDVHDALADALCSASRGAVTDTRITLAPAVSIR